MSSLLGGLRGCSGRFRFAATTVSKVSIFCLSARALQRHTLVRGIPCLRLIRFRICLTLLFVSCTSALYPLVACAALGRLALHWIYRMSAGFNSTGYNKPSKTYQRDHARIIDYFFGLIRPAAGKLTLRVLPQRSSCTRTTNHIPSRAPTMQRILIQLSISDRAS